MKSDLTFLEELFIKSWEEETKHVCKIQTYRAADRSTDVEVNKRIFQIRDYIDEKVESFNKELSNLQITRFQWCQDHDGTHDHPSDDKLLHSQYWIMGYRFGPKNADRKLALICHLDTVPASADGWGDFDPFDPKQEFREYPTSTNQNFLVGRGCIDDKGPAMSAFIVLRALAKALDGRADTQSVEFEVIFDTSEETDMATPVYIESNPENHEPDIGVVFDAYWIVRAEKGLARPNFTFDDATPLGDSLYIASIDTGGNSANTIPDMCEAAIKTNGASLDDFENSVAEMYKEYVFDDAEYVRAPLEVKRTSDAVILKTTVVGAQHGSAPEENRANGANPLVSLANFLGGLTKSGQLAVTAASTACTFIEWMWGTYAFGEKHTDLYKYDNIDGSNKYETIFAKGNGTTYAVTKLGIPEDADGNGMKLALDIDVRYAIPHHIQDWDGKEEGLIDGDGTTLDAIFSGLTEDFNKKRGMGTVTFGGSGWYFGPDIRIPENSADFLKVEQAYEEVTGSAPTRYAIGGGTDAKGNLNLIAVGPLMSPSMGPPINYHGLSEGAPICDMFTSTKIMFNFLMLEATEPHVENADSAWRKVVARKKTEKQMQQLRERGFKFCCNH